MPKTSEKPPRPQLDGTVLVEEETLSSYRPANFYPVRIGDVLGKKYRVVAKLGFGQYSTVWLTKDTKRLRLRSPRFMALKVLTADTSDQSLADSELASSTTLRYADPQHPGLQSLRIPRDSFQIKGPSGSHLCLVYEPMRETLRELFQRFRGPLPLMSAKYLIRQLIMGLHYLHDKCHIIDTDIHDNNILFEIEDTGALLDMEHREKTNPCPAKVYEDRCVYVSRYFKGKVWPGPPRLGDFGLAVPGPGPHTHPIQPIRLQAPEVVLGAKWSYSADIWNLGALLWTILERRSLFNGKLPDSGKYSKAVHLQEMVTLLGRPPPTLLQQSPLCREYFSTDGDLINKAAASTHNTDLESTIILMGQKMNSGEKKEFLSFARRMLKWLPEERATAEELLSDPFLDIA